MKTITDEKGKRSDKLKKRVKVRRTPVGKGVFARRDYAVEDVIGEITGQVMGTDYQSNYCMDLDGKAILEPDSPFRFLNHSCTPNCELLLWKRQKVAGRKIHRLWLGALREVQAGDELTIDYAWPADAAVPCLCGAGTCRGWIVDQPELKSLRRRLKGK